MEMQEHTCLLDHPHRHTHPRPSSNPVGTTVPLAIAHILIGLHSQTQVAYRPISHALIPNNIMKIRSNQPHQSHNTAIEIANRFASSTLYATCCLIYFGHTKRGRGREARCDGLAGEEESWPIPKPLSILDTPWKRSMNRNDDVHSPHTRKPLHCDLPARNSQQNMHVTTCFDNT